MRRFLVVAALLFVLVPASVRAGSFSGSQIRFSHPDLSPGSAQTVTVVARDLSGHPLRAAHVVLVVHLASRTAHIHTKPTNAHGMTSVVLHPSAALHGTRVYVNATISTRDLDVPVSASFVILGAPALPVSPDPSPVPTVTKTATPVAGASASSGTLTVTAQAVTASATAPAPILMVVRVHGGTGQPLANVGIRATAVFDEGLVPVSGTTDATGAATLRVDTGIARSNQTVYLTASASWQGQTAFGEAEATISVPATATPVPTATFLPTTIPTSTPVLAPTDIPSPVNTLLPTSTPAPSNTPAPTATNIPTPVPTATLPTSCNGDSCMGAMLAVLNNTRAQHGLAPLSLDLTQSNGTGSCVGSIGHSIAMEESGSIWHDNPAYPAASFPNNNCYYGGVNSPPVAQNVGMMSGSNEMADLTYVHNLMMSEPYSPGCTGDHACNILSTIYSRVGIGIYYVNGAVWLTEDFIG